MNKKLVIFYMLTLLIISMSILPFSANAKTKITEGKKFSAQAINKENYAEGLLPVKVKGKWGYMGTNGKMAIKAQFTQVGAFSNGRAIVKKNKKEGFINKKGKFYAPGKYGYVDQFKDGYIVVHNKNYDFCVMNAKGKIVIPCKYDRIEGGDNGHFIFAYKGKEGIINTKNKVIYKSKFYLINYSGGLLQGSQDKFYTAKGKYLFTYKGIYNEEAVSNGFMISNLRKFEGVGAMDMKGKMVIPYKHRVLEAYSNGLIGYSIRGMKYYKVGYYAAKTKDIQVEMAVKGKYEITDKAIFYTKKSSAGLKYAFTPNGENLTLKNSYSEFSNFSKGYAVGVDNQADNKFRFIKIN